MGTASALAIAGQVDACGLFPQPSDEEGEWDGLKNRPVLGIGGDLGQILAGQVVVVQHLDFQGHHRLGRLAETQAALENAVAIRRRISPDRLVLGFALDNLTSVLGQRSDLDVASIRHINA